MERAAGYSRQGKPWILWPQGAVMLIGREPEMRAIGDVITSARQGQAGSLVLTGEPGIGKSTLLQWSRQIADGFSLLAVHGTPADATLGFAGLLQIVRPLSG